ncbi:MAG: hypothetical protein AB7F75_09440 [Planctomycetota bacterium]
MNPRDFFQHLLRRQKADAIVPGAFIVVGGTLVAGLLDWYFRLGMLWRAILFLSILVGGLTVIRKKWGSARLPHDEEMYAWAAREARHGELDHPLESLVINPQRLRPYPVPRMMVLGLVMAVSLALAEGRMVWTRIWLLSGTWPARTRIEALDVSRVALQGDPVQVRFRTEGRQPPLVRLTFGAETVQLVGSGSPDWDYATYLEPGVHAITIEAGDALERIEGIEIIKAPQLIGASFRITEPEYLGGKSWQSEGLTARVPELSRVMLETKVEGGESLRVGPRAVERNTEGMAILDMGVISADHAMALEVVVGHGLRDAVLARAQLFVVKDQPPVAEVLRPAESITLPVGALLPLTLRFRDDRALVSACIVAEDTERVVLEAVAVSGVEGSWEGKVNLPPGIKAGGRVIVRPEAVDSKGQTSRGRGITVHVVDDETFVQHLTEQKQEISRRLEKLVESQERRVSRKERAKTMSPSAERQSARDDARAVDELEALLKDHKEQLEQSKSGESQAAETQKDIDSLKQDVRPPMADEASGMEASLEDHKKSLGIMKDMADRMAKSQDLHAVLRLLDTMIDRQKKVVEGLGR